MQELTLLNDKLDRLLKKYTELQAENKRLKETVNTQLKSIETLNGKLALLEENMMAASIGTAMLNDGEKQVVKKQLDSVLAEIDKILATLND
ncbi:MAG TPA: hypothetical protein VGD89_15300 [Flavipsychrobacter sp.]|jgi:chaperonin cofactor prefoldin